MTFQLVTISLLSHSLTQMNGWMCWLIRQFQLLHSKRISPETESSRYDILEFLFLFLLSWSHIIGIVLLLYSKLHEEDDRAIQALRKRVEERTK
jgi:ABC-type spermidine/putrescine transport system permease subunit I